MLKNSNQQNFKGKNSGFLDMTYFIGRNNTTKYNFQKISGGGGTPKQGLLTPQNVLIYIITNQSMLASQSQIKSLHLIFLVTPRKINESPQLIGLQFNTFYSVGTGKKRGRFAFFFFKSKLITIQLLPCHFYPHNINTMCRQARSVYDDPFRGFPGRKHPKGLYHSRLLGAAWDGAACPKPHSPGSTPRRHTQLDPASCLELNANHDFNRLPLLPSYGMTDISGATWGRRRGRGHLTKQKVAFLNDCGDGDRMSLEML